MNEGSKTALTNHNHGHTRTQALYLQDEWKFAPKWTLTAGVRQEKWQASEGEIYTSSLGSNSLRERTEHGTSPKLSLAWQATDDWTLRASFRQGLPFPDGSRVVPDREQWFHDPYQ